MSRDDLVETVAAVGSFEEGRDWERRGEGGEGREESSARARSFPPSTLVGKNENEEMEASLLTDLCRFSTLIGELDCGSEEKGEKEGTKGDGRGRTRSYDGEEARERKIGERARESVKV